MTAWSCVSKAKAFIKQDEIARDIQRCHDALSDCMIQFEVRPSNSPPFFVSLPFQLTSHMELHDWQAQFELASQQDHRELVEYLAEIQNSQELVHDAVYQTSSEVREMMTVMQTASAFIC